MPETVNLLRNYIREWQLGKPQGENSCLFFNRRGEPLSTNGVRYILRKYVKQTEDVSTNRRNRVTPHTLRHSKAMHLLQSGNDLPIIQFFLGHAELKTTMVYARADVEMTRAALAKTPGVDPENEPSYGTNNLDCWNGLNNCSTTLFLCEVTDRKTLDYQDINTVTSHNVSMEISGAVNDEGH